MMKSALLVLGADSAVGAGVVATALEAGWEVAATGSARDRLAALRQRHPRAALRLLRAHVRGERSAAALANEAQRLGRPLAGVVAAFDLPDAYGRLLELSAGDLRRAWDATVQPHLAAARHLLPLLAAGGRGGSYVLVGAPGSERPWAGHGARSVAAASLRMLARVLHDEARSLPVRVQLLSLDAPVRADDDVDGCPHWPCAREVGRHALALVERRGSPDAVVHCHARDRQPATPHTPRAPAQDPDSDAPLLTARCLQDARTLLDSIALPPPRKGVSG